MAQRWHKRLSESVGLWLLRLRQQAMQYVNGLTVDIQIATSLRILLGHWQCLGDGCLPCYTTTCILLEEGVGCNSTILIAAPPSRNYTLDHWRNRCHTTSNDLDQKSALPFRQHHPAYFKLYIYGVSDNLRRGCLFDGLLNKHAGAFTDIQASTTRPSDLVFRWSRQRSTTCARGAEPPEREQSTIIRARKHGRKVDYSTRTLVLPWGTTIGDNSNSLVESSDSTHSWSVR